MPKDTHTKTIHIALVEDHPIFREGLANILEKEDNMKVVLEASNGQDFLDQLTKRNTHVDIVLLDLDMPILDGYETCKVLVSQYPNMKIIAISSHNQKIYIKKILYLGAHGYLVKNTLPTDVVFHVNQVMENEFYLTNEIMQMVYDAFRKSSKKAVPKQGVNLNFSLSDREKNVLLLICQEYTTKEIANQLSLSDRTIERHRDRLFKKLKVKNVVGLVVSAIKYDLVDINLI